MKNRILVILIMVVTFNFSAKSQHHVNFEFGGFMSGYYDLKDNMYGVGYQYNFLKRFGVKVGYQRATATWRDYTHVQFFAPSKNIPSYTPDFYYSAIHFDVEGQDRISSGWDAFSETYDIGYNRRIPPQLTSEITLLTLTGMVSVLNKSKDKINLLGGVRYLNNKIIDAGITAEEVAVNPVSGNDERIKVLLILKNYERQREFGFAYGLNYTHIFKDRVGLGLNAMVGNFKFTSIFITFGVEAVCKI